MSLGRTTFLTPGCSQPPIEKNQSKMGGVFGNAAIGVLQVPFCSDGPSPFCLHDPPSWWPAPIPVPLPSLALDFTHMPLRTTALRTALATPMICPQLPQSDAEQVFSHAPRTYEGETLAIAEDTYTVSGVSRCATSLRSRAAVDGVSQHGRIIRPPMLRARHETSRPLGHVRPLHPAAHSRGVRPARPRILIPRRCTDPTAGEGWRCCVSRR